MGRSRLFAVHFSNNNDNNSNNHNNKKHAKIKRQREKGAVNGRSQAIDPDELFETANRLEADGKEVTALALLNALGRGSLTTIYKHLENWKVSRPAKISTTNNEMPESVKRAFDVAWREAAQEAAREVQAVKEKAAEEVQAALKQFHGALEAIEKLEKESDQDALDIEAFKTQVADQQMEIAKLESDSAAQKATAVELRRQQESQIAELERLHSELEKQKLDRDEAIKDAAELKGKTETLQNQYEQLLAKWTTPDRAKEVRK